VTLDVFIWHFAAAHVLGVVKAIVDGLISEMAYFIRSAIQQFIQGSRFTFITCFPNHFYSVRAFSESGPSEWAAAVEFITPPKAHRKAYVMLLLLLLLLLLPLPLLLHTRNQQVRVVRQRHWQRAQHV
jgi:hypothetical protein